MRYYHDYLAIPANAPFEAADIAIKTMLAEFKVTTLARHLTLDKKIKHELINLCIIIRRDLKNLLGYLRSPELKKHYDERLAAREAINDDFTTQIENVMVARKMIWLCIRHEESRDHSTESQQTIEALHREIAQLEDRNRLLSTQLLAAQQATYSQQPQALFAKVPDQAPLAKEPTPPTTSLFSVGPKLARTKDLHLPEILKVLKVFTLDEHNAAGAPSAYGFTHVVFEFETPENANYFLECHRLNTLLIRANNPSKEKKICTEFKFSVIDEIGKRLLISTVQPDAFWPILLHCHVSHSTNHRKVRPYQRNAAVTLMPILREAFDLEKVPCHYFEGTQLDDKKWKLDGRDPIFVPHEVKDPFTLENVLSRINEFANSENQITRLTAESLLKNYTHQPQPSTTLQPSHRS